MTETTAKQSLSEISQEGQAAPRSQLPMILWCGGLALAFLAHWLVNAGQALERQGVWASLGLLWVVGYSIAAWRFAQLGRGAPLPNLWGLRLFSALIFVLVVVGCLGMGLLKNKQGMPGGLAIPLALVAACIIAFVLIAPLFVLNRRAKSEASRNGGIKDLVASGVAREVRPPVDRSAEAAAQEPSEPEGGPTRDLSQAEHLMDICRIASVGIARSFLDRLPSFWKTVEDSGTNEWDFYVTCGAVHVAMSGLSLSDDAVARLLGEAAQWDADAPRAIDDLATTIYPMLQNGMVPGDAVGGWVIANLLRRGPESEAELSAAHVMGGMLFEVLGELQADAIGK